MLEINNSVPVNFKGKKNKLIELTRKVTRAVSNSDKTTKELVKDDCIETAMISYYENLAKDIMSKLNVQQAKITYKK